MRVAAATQFQRMLNRALYDERDRGLRDRADLGWAWAESKFCVSADEEVALILLTHAGFLFYALLAMTWRPTGRDEQVQYIAGPRNSVRGSKGYL